MRTPRAVAAVIAALIGVAAATVPASPAAAGGTVPVVRYYTEPGGVWLKVDQISAADMNYNYAYRKDAAPQIIRKLDSSGQHSSPIRVADTGDSLRVQAARYVSDHYETFGPSSPWVYVNTSEPDDFAFSMQVPRSASGIAALAWGTAQFAKDKAGSCAGNKLFDAAYDKAIRAGEKSKSTYGYAAAQAGRVLKKLDAETFTNSCDQIAQVLEYNAKVVALVMSSSEAVTWRLNAFWQRINNAPDNCIFVVNVITKETNGRPSNLRISERPGWGGRDACAKEAKRWYD